MNKQHILDEIRSTAKANGGIPLGRKRFTEETGIDDREWFGKYWGRWSDAVQEAGLAPNALRDAYNDEMLIEKLVEFIQELGRFPGNGNIRMKKRSDPSFPNDKVFDAHFGTRLKLRQAVVKYCQTHPGFDDVPPLCGPIPSNVQPKNEKTPASTIKGFVYLMKSGKYHKIGKTNATGRREYELAIQLPEKLNTVHVIKTDDPDGIEAYWHRRFATKRANGEWFELSREDVEAFKRRKFM